MSEKGVNVAKSAPQSKTGNKVALQKVKIYYQVFPGVEGSDPERGIPKVPYKIHTKVNGQVITQKGETAVDGGLELNLPIDATAVVEIFNTLYVFPVVGRLYSGPETRSGVIRRLECLGYILDDDGGMDDALALMDFQADSDIHANGNYDDKTIVNEIKQAFGE